MIFLVFTATILGIFWLWARGETLKRQGISRRGAAAVSARRQGAQSRGRKSVAAPAVVNSAVNKITAYTHNQDVSARLLRAAQLANRGRSLDWCVEKIIHDLVRDRR
ncbi:MAG: hypothetical protein WBB18_05550 [Nodosilinea sp.]